jgi:UV-stimulated scaffold protein A
MIESVVERLTSPSLFDVSRAATVHQHDWSSVLDATLLSQLKQFAKQSNDNVKRVRDLLWARLASRTAQTRLASLAALDVLFQRSAYCRKLTVAALTDLIALTIGGNSSRPVPGAEPVRLALRNAALAALERWHGEHSALYPQLAVSLAFVRDTLRLELPSAAAARQAAAAQAQAAQLQRRLHAKFAQLAPVLKTRLPELQEVIEEMERGVALLVPFDDEAARAADDDGDDGGAHTTLGDMGMPESVFEIDVVVDTTVPAVHETGDNDVLFATLREHARVLQKWLATDAVVWEVTLTRLEPSARKLATQRNRLLFDLLDAKTSARAVLDQCSDMGVLADAGDEDEQWEDAPEKDGFENFAVEPRAPPLRARPPSSPRESAKRSKAE